MILIKINNSCYLTAVIAWSLTASFASNYSFLLRNILEAKLHEYDCQFYAILTVYFTLNI